MGYFTTVIVLTLCVSELAWTRNLDYNGFEMQGDTHGWFGNFVEEEPRKVPKGCGGKPADVYFVMDTSGDVTQGEIDLQKGYLKELSRLFYFGLDTMRVGVISSGSTALTAARLGTHDNADSLSQAIEVTPRVGGERDLAQTLDYLRRKAFAPSVARQQVAHVAILMTNGFSHNPKLTEVEARLLKKSGVYVYTVSLGGRVDKSALSAMASFPPSDYIFTSDDYNIVDPLINLLRIHECDYQIHPSEQKAAACIPKRHVDMVFSVDHLHIGAVNSQHILNFINSLVKEFDHSDNLNTGLLLSRPASTGGLSNSLTSIRNTEEELSRVTFPDLGALLRRTRRTLTKGREFVQKTAVVFLDSNVPLTMAAFKEAKRNKFKKIETYVIYIGDEYNKNSLSLISNGVLDDNIIIVPSYHELDIARDEVLTTLCKGL